MTCRFFEIPSSALYEWRQAYAQAWPEEVDAQPAQRPARWEDSPTAHNEFHYGAQGIVWHLRRCEDLKVSITGVATRAWQWSRATKQRPCDIETEASKSV